MVEHARQRIDGRLVAKVLFGVLVAAFVWSPFIAMTWKMASRNRMSAPAPVPPSNLNVTPRP
ncbi:hypothetical protein [Cyanobium sp. Morenito 9A2]|uniref:hypothetical protein n=1 Tax=Cyanobium sp. Morenito 9A2 TaxID=2823718 RepID=UPI0020CD04DB|nr:hypothetical protein [Cyanobium sp. Morenito 9A2]MCP9848755.1 hypothetical protein [Cyanobium sp. Morenito 9A2]